MWKKEISTWQMWFASVGGIVGSAWLLGPFYAVQIAGSHAILAWVLGGVMMLFVALTFAELATSLPMPGGMARYAQLTHGPLSSFMIAWVAYLAAVIVPPIETMAAVQYLSTQAPGLVIHRGGHIDLSVMGIGLSAFIMLALCAINCSTVKLFAKSNVWIVVWKIIIPVAAIGVLVSKQFDLRNFDAMNLASGSQWHQIFHALPVAGIIFAYIGYSPAIQLSAEAKNPQRAVPVAIVGSILFAIVLYVCIETAFIGAIPHHLLSGGWSNLHFSHDSGPVAGLMILLGVGWFIKLIYLDAIVSPIGTALIYTASTARITYAMSRNNSLPKSIQKLNGQGSPWRAILLNFFVGMIFFLPFRGWETMVGFIVSCFVLSYVIGPVAAVIFRKSLPNLDRPFTCYSLTVVAFIAFVVCALLVYWTGWNTVHKMMIVVLIGLLYLTVFRFFDKSQTKEPLLINKSIWLWIYFGGLTVVSYLGNFSGTHVLQPGYDVLALVVMSAVSWTFAIRSKKADLELPAGFRE